MATLTLARLKELLHYDPETGVFTWKVRRCGRALVGAPAGTTYSNGYHYIWLEGVRYFAHRLAWFYVHGRWPPNDIDHIDFNRANNAISNLREATESQNHFRVRTKKTRRGVSETRGRWRARISVKGIELHLGYFPNPDDAQAAYRSAALKHFGEFADGVI